MQAPITPPPQTITRMLNQTSKDYSSGERNVTREARGALILRREQIRWRGSPRRAGLDRCRACAIRRLKITHFIEDRLEVLEQVRDAVPRLELCPGSRPNTIECG